jgi:hypothetical protein
MKRVNGIGALAVLAVVLIVVGLAAGSLHHDTPQATRGIDKGASGAVAVVPTEASTAAPIVAADQVPGLRGRPAQHDVEEDAPAVRSYERTHRLLEQLPQTYRGVSFDSAGRTKSGRVRVTANPNGLTPSDARRVYRQLLARTHDPGTRYRLVVTRPDAHSP